METNIKTITTSTGTYMFVTVPKEADKFQIHYSPIGNKYKEGFELNYATYGLVPNEQQDLPNGKYSILGTVRFEAGEVKLQGFGTNYKEIYAIEERVRNKTFPFYWVNPLGEEPSTDDYTINNNDRTQTFKVSKYNDAKQAWREAEDLKLKDDQAVVVIKVEEKS